MSGGELSIAENLQPIELVVDDPPCGRQHLVRHLQPPQLRFGELRESKSVSSSYSEQGWRAEDPSMARWPLCSHEDR